ncbi:chromosomal replication initiator protein DnaA, partial [Methylobacterium organophilum]|nr:chromosomal replication initiator protein DnaA [Methylobacterium organophilum]
MRVDGTVASDDDGGRNGGGNTDYGSAWARVKRRLRAELGEDVFASWFARLELETVAGGTARLTVPTRFLKSWIESHYLDRVLNTFKAEVEEIARIEVGVRGTGAPVRPVAAGVAKAGPASGPLATVPSTRITGSPDAAHGDPQAARTHDLRPQRPARTG